MFCLLINTLRSLCSSHALQPFLQACVYHFSPPGLGRPRAGGPRLRHSGMTVVKKRSGQWVPPSLHSVWTLPGLAGPSLATRRQRLRRSRCRVSVSSGAALTCGLLPMKAALQRGPCSVRPRRGVNLETALHQRGRREDVPFLWEVSTTLNGCYLACQ